MLAQKLSNTIPFNGTLLTQFPNASLFLFLTCLLMSMKYCLPYICSNYSILPGTEVMEEKISSDGQKESIVGLKEHNN